MEEFRLLVIADDPLARAGLAMLLESLPCCYFVEQMSSEEITADEWEFDMEAVSPDVIIWDLGWDALEIMPQWDEIECPIIALLADETQAAAAWQAGAQALLYRQMDAEKITAAVQAVTQGLVIVEPGLVHLFPAWINPAETAPAAELTPRESEVLQLLAEGVTNRAIAQRLDISEHTVKFHVNAIMSKLGAQSRTEAVVRATRLGLILL